MLSDTIREHLGFVPAMDVAYYDHLGQKVETTISVQGGVDTKGIRKSDGISLDWDISEDYDLVEDWDEDFGNYRMEACPTQLIHTGV